MNTFTERLEQTKCMVHETACPFNGVSVCTASLSSMAIDNQKRASYCSTDNYDNCPLFLAKILRRG
jgi:hypothetical protein